MRHPQVELQASFNEPLRYDRELIRTRAACGCLSTSLYLRRMGLGVRLLNLGVLQHTAVVDTSSMRYNERYKWGDKIPRSLASKEGKFRRCWVYPEIKGGQWAAVWSLSQPGAFLCL